MSKAQPIKATDKDFGRRLYASDKGYTEQMKEVTDKAMLDVAPFHLSEFKKPYLDEGGYEEMEHMYWKPEPGPLPPLPPRPPYISGPKDKNRTNEGDMRWKTKPPDEGEPEHWYLVEVWNRVKEQTTTQRGKVTSYKRTYYPAWFEMKSVEAGTKGFKLEISLPYAVLDAHGEIRGFQAGNNVWYDIKEQQGTIKAILSYLKEKGTTQASTTARLTLDEGAEGEAEIKAKDGKTELKEKVKVVDDALVLYLTTTGKYYKFSDLLMGGVIPYDNITDAKSPALGGVATSTTSTSTDLGRPVETFTNIHDLSFDGVLYLMKISHTYETYAWYPPWVYLFSNVDGDVLGVNGTNSGYLKAITDLDETITKTYFKHAGHDEITVYDCNIVHTLSTGHWIGYYYYLSYEFDANNYSIYGENRNSSGVVDKWLFKGSNNGVLFSLELPVSFLPLIGMMAIKYGSVHN